MIMFAHGIILWVTLISLILFYFTYVSNISDNYNEIY
jgi:hypothetical protein